MVVCVDRVVVEQQRLIVEGVRGLREFFGIAQQGVAALGVDAEVFPAGDLAAKVIVHARLADRGALDVEVAVAVEHTRGGTVEGDAVLLLDGEVHGDAAAI